METEKTPNGIQGLFEYKFYEDERQKKEREYLAKKESWKHLPTFQKPKNDNERLFNFQFQYYNGKPEALTKIFKVLLEIAPRLINIESKKRRLKLTQEKIDEMSIDAASLFAVQIKKNELVITTSFISYLRFQVLKVLFYQSERDMFEKWLMQLHVDMVYADPKEIEGYKRVFMREVLGREVVVEEIKPGDYYQLELF